MQDALGDMCLSSDDDMFRPLSGASCQVSGARCYEVMIGGCQSQPGVESQSSDGLKTPAVHLFRKVELLFSGFETII